jgi:hypothetical protein
MHSKSWFGFIALITVFSLNGVGLQAQRGRGQGQGQPARAGKPAQNPHKPATPHGNDSADHASRGQRPTASQLVTKNPHLAAKLQTLLPGENLENASAGFRNLGEFVAAAHVSHNLDIPFDQLKDRVTGVNATSLGKAIHELKPAANADAEAKKASRTADADIKESQGRKPPS